MAEKGYFNIDLTPQEIALVRYIANYVKEKEKTSKLSAVRLAKIVVHVVIKLKIPVRMFWYDMGLLPVAQIQVPVSYDFNSERPFIEESIAPLKMEVFDTVICEGIKQYPKESKSTAIRKQQYELLGDPLYLTKLELEEFVDSPELMKNRSKFVKTLSKFILHIPTTNEYDTMNTIAARLAVLANSLLAHTNPDKKTYESIARCIETALNYLNGLNARYKFVEGLEALFERNIISVKDIEQRLWNAQSSLLQLDRMLSEKINTSPLELKRTDLLQAVHSDLSEMLLSKI